MYIPGQNQQVLYQNINVTVPQNQNKVIINNQVVYPMILPSNQVKNNPQIQNVQQFQNPNILPQPPIIKSPNSQGNINIVPKQIIINPGYRKTYSPGRLNQALNNQQIPPKQIVIQPQPNRISDPLLKKNNRLANNYLNQSASPVIQNYQVPHLIQPQKPIYVMPNNIGSYNHNQDQKDNLKKSATLMTLKSLANLHYNEYPMAEFSKKPFFNISGFGSNSYNGKIKGYNEDKVKYLVDYKNNAIINKLGYSPHISYFGVFDGHGGDKCSKFLREKLDEFLFNSPTFPNNPIESIRDAFIKAENEFFKIAVQNNMLVDQSGSCALVALIINNMLYAINLGDSRGLYSRNGGRQFYQITRDHKPNDEIEKRRIEMNGGKVYYANTTIVNGVQVTLSPEQFGKGFKFPYRLEPGGLAVVRTIGDYYSKIPELGGKSGTNIPYPCVNLIPIDDESDFILLGCKKIY